MTPSLAGCETFGSELRSGKLGRRSEAAFRLPTDSSRSTLTRTIFSEYAPSNLHAGAEGSRETFRGGRVATELRSGWNLGALFFSGNQGNSSKVNIIPLFSSAGGHAKVEHVVGVTVARRSNNGDYSHQTSTNPKPEKQRLAESGGSGKRAAPPCLCSPQTIKPV